MHQGAQTISSRRVQGRKYKSQVEAGIGGRSKGWRLASVPAVCKLPIPARAQTIRGSF